MYKFPDNEQQNIWDALIASDHWFEVRVVVSGVTYEQGSIKEMSSDYSMFEGDNPGVGACLAGELYVSLIDPDTDIPRMALVEPYVRATDGETTSEWVPQGKFFIDTREVTQNDDGLPILALHCYDAMLKTESDYPNTSHGWPIKDIEVAEEIAQTIGVSVDPRTYELLTRDYDIGLPAGYSMREVLSNIASMYAGNWIMSYAGELLFVAVNGIPPETNYLISHAFDEIIFGTEDGTLDGEAVKILV